MPRGVCPSLPDGAPSEGADDSVVVVGGVVGCPIRGEDDVGMGTMAIARKLPRWSCTWMAKCAHERRAAAAAAAIPVFLAGRKREEAATNDIGSNMK